MHPDLSKLLDVQEKDEALRALDDRDAALRAEETALDAALGTLAQGVEAATRGVRDAERRRDEVEARVDSLRTHQQQRQQRLEFVRNPKEAAALMADLDLSRTMMTKEEGEWMQLSEAVGAAEQRVAERAAARDATREAQRGERTAIDERRRAVAAERDAVTMEREARAGRLDRPLRARYDKLLRRRAANVVVPVRKNACSVCHTTIPLSRRGQLKGGLLLEGCEACGAILYASDVNG